VIARPLDIDFVELLKEFHRDRISGDKRRSEGLHLSEIVHSIIKKLDPKRFPDGEVEAEVAHMGFLFEDTLSWVFAKEFSNSKQQEIEYDDILMTIDGWRNGRVQEFKCTKMSAANPITSHKFMPWMIRTKGYCKALGVREAELVVLFVNGSYELGGGRFGTTRVKGWRLEWSEREIEENWQMIRRERDRILQGQRQKTKPRSGGSGSKGSAKSGGRSTTDE
jgi:hypothetical protein